MTTAYVVQIDGPKVQYMSTNGVLTSVPKFFRSAPTVKSYLNGKGYGAARYNYLTHRASTKVIAITELENGLKESRAKIMTADEFLMTSAVQPAKSNDRAFYKLRMKDGTLAGISKTVKANKFGKVWNSASSLRRYLTETYRGIMAYEGCNVIETVMDDDNINIKSILETPALDFYLQSESSRARYEQDKKIVPTPIMHGPASLKPEPKIEPPPRPTAYLDSLSAGAATWPGFATTR